MIRVREISKSYGSVVALADVSVAFPRGETTGLIGASGSGKTTLLSLIVGLDEPDRGGVEIDGAPMTAQNAERLRRRMGYVIQDGGLFPHLDARRNVELMARELRFDAARREARVRELAQLVNLPQETLDRYPAELSGGQRQRVSLMRALMLDPEILLFDEPLGALDPMIRANLQDDLKSIFERLRKTVVLVTHDLSEAAFFCRGVVLMNEGRIVQQGSFDELVERPQTDYARAFVEAQRKRFAALSERAS